MIKNRKDPKTYEKGVRRMLNVFILLAFILALGYNIYVKTTFSLVIVLVIAAIGIIYRIYNGKKQDKNINSLRKSLNTGIFLMEEKCLLINNTQSHVFHLKPLASL